MKLRLSQVLLYITLITISFKLGMYAQGVISKDLYSQEDRRAYRECYNSIAPNIELVYREGKVTLQQKEEALNTVKQECTISVNNSKIK